MEPAGAVAIAKDLQTKGVKVSHLIGDDDATTIAHLRSQVNAGIAKSSDFNYVKKKTQGIICTHFKLLATSKCLKNH